ncbi:MAG: lytic transglycosylase domain-containing protein [Bacteroidota bacterium]
MKKGLQLYTLIMAGFLTIAVLASYSKKEDLDAYRSAAATKNIPQIVTPIDLDRPFEFAGEQVPMDNFDAKERLDRELTVNTYWHSSTILNIKQTTRYFPMIEKILEEQGIPDDFKYLAVAESSLRNAVSPAGAKGIWQFMKKTGEYYGLEVNKEVDERYHVEKATHAACKYLKDYYKRFGSWTLSAAAYNMGGTRLARDLKSQHATTYYDLNLNQETARYVFRIIAIKEILKDPRNFGFYLEEEEYYAPLEDYESITVDGAVENWGDFAQKNGISYRLLKIYNPWLVASKLTNKGRKEYKIKVPRKKF